MRRWHLHFPVCAAPWILNGGQLSLCHRHVTKRISSGPSSARTLDGVRESVLFTCDNLFTTGLIADRFGEVADAPKNITRLLLSRRDDMKRRRWNMDKGVWINWRTVGNGTPYKVSFMMWDRKSFTTFNFLLFSSSFLGYGPRSGRYAPIMRTFRGSFSDAIASKYRTSFHFLGQLVNRLPKGRKFHIQNLRYSQWLGIVQVYQDLLLNKVNGKTIDLVSILLMCLRLEIIYQSI